MASRSENDSPLHSAVRLGQLEEVRRILDEPDMDVNCLNSNRETPIHLACALGHPSIIELLMSFGANVFIKDSNSKDCYGRMTSQEVCNLVNKLLYTQSFWLKGPTLTEKNTPLHDSVKLGQLETVQDILDQRSVDINDKNSAHETPLHLACALGHNVIVHMLMTNGARLSMYARDSYNNVPIHRAASMGHISIVDMLITEFGCNPTIRGYQGRSLLHFACGSGNATFVEVVIQRKWLDPVIDRDACGLTLLHIAALCGPKKVINMLISIFSCPIDCKNEAAETPLHVACIIGHTNVVKLLVSEHNADLNAHNFQNNSPLHLAARYGHTNVIKILISDYNCNPHEKGFQGRIILHEACLNGYVELAETLITDFGLDPMCVDDNKNTPLHYAALGGDLSVVRMLVSQHNADLNARNNQNDSPLLLAARCRHTSLVKALINDFNCNRNEKGFEGRTILHEACINGHAELAETLITDFGLDPMCVVDKKNTPLHYAAWGGDLSVVRMLVSQHNADLKSRNNQNNSPLLLAARFGHTSVVKALINDFNCNRNEKGFEGKTILHKACLNGHVELAETLITDFGLDPMCVDDGKYTPLHCAAWGGHLSVVRMLVSQHNADLNARNNQNDSPLLLAARCGHTSVVKALIIDFNCNRNEKGFEGRTIIHAACEFGHVELAETLITDFSLDPMCVDDNKNTPLHYAAWGGHLSVVRMFVSQHNASLNARNKNNDSPFHLAVWKGHGDVVKVMINELNIEGLQTQAAVTAFSRACKQGHKELAIALITDLVCLSALSTDSDGNTLLHIAAMYKQEQCVSMLLYTYDAPIYLRNNAGKTARELAKSSIRELIDNYLKQNRGNIQASYKELQLLSTKKYYGEQRLTRIFVVGHIQSGKSTLIEALKSEGYLSFFYSISEATVPPHTSGIVPSIHYGKTTGRVLYYDFAGDPEYYSSHSAIMSNIMQSKIGANVFLTVVNFTKDIDKIQEEIGYWFRFISCHSSSVCLTTCTCTVIVIGSHVDLITAAEKNSKLKSLYQFMHTQWHSSNTYFQISGDILTLDCRQPWPTQCVRDAIFQISKDTLPYSLSLKAAILLGLLEKDFKHVVTCKIHSLLHHIKETKICLPAVAEYLYPILEQLHDVGLLMIIGRSCDKLEDNILLLNISKLTNDVHELLFFKSAIEKATSMYASMGILPQSFLKSILPEYLTIECLVQLQYCQSFSHIEVKADYVAPAKYGDNPILFYFPALCTVEKRESIVSPDDFNYHIGCFIECKGIFDYFPPRFLHVLLLRLAYLYALRVPPEIVCVVKDSEPDLAIVQQYNCRCTMWKNGIHWLMEKGVECFVEMVNNSKGIVAVTKSEETHNYKSVCIEMLFKIIREVQEAKEEFCDPVTLQHYLMNSDDPLSFTDKDRLFAMSEVERVLREGNPSIVSINGCGHLDSKKIHHLMKCTLWSKLKLISTCSRPF